MNELRERAIASDAAGSLEALRSLVGATESIDAAVRVVEDG
jgi:hypothetical protein